MRRWEPYDPSWLVEELESHGRPDLVSAASACTSALVFEVMTYFVDPAEPNAPGSEWQSAGSVEIYDSRFGQIVVDVMASGKIGAVEYVDRIRS